VGAMLAGSLIDDDDIGFEDGRLHIGGFIGILFGLAFSVVLYDFFNITEKQNAIVVSQDRLESKQLLHPKEITVSDNITDETLLSVQKELVSLREKANSSNDAFEQLYIKINRLEEENRDLKETLETARRKTLSLHGLD